MEPVQLGFIPVCGTTLVDSRVVGRARVVCAQWRCVGAVPRRRRVVCAAGGGGGGSEEEEMKRMERAAEVDRMRYRLEGLFGASSTKRRADDDASFDGRRLRELIKERWGVQYDVQPQKRHGRVYIQIMWRYFEQQSFYLEEDEFASHCEAVADLLKQWNATEFFKDYILSTKKRPVVGITINIPIPGIDAATAAF